jgi:hypothetical protein
MNMDPMEEMLLVSNARMIIVETANGRTLPEIGMMLYKMGHDSGHFCAQMDGEHHQHPEVPLGDQVTAGYL